MVAAVFAMATAASAAPETWVIDPVHSGVGFKVRHFLNKVPGSFGSFTGTIVFDPEDLGASKAEAVISTGSINTHNDRRDDHLRNPDYFNAPQFPEIRFTSTSWEKKGENSFTVVGDLTMLQTTKPVTLEVTLLGTMEGRGGALVSGWEARGTLDRTLWGITSGTPVVGTEVEIEINLQATRR